MQEERKIKVVKGGAGRGKLRADEHREKRKRELKKIKDELLTLARRVEVLASEDSAQVTTE